MTVCRAVLIVLGSLFGARIANAESYVAHDVITLEAAYDRALASDQSIRRAYWGIRSANLEPRSALTRLAPSLNGSASLLRSEERRRATAVETVFDEPTSVGGTGTATTRTVTSVTRTRTDNGALGITYQQTIFDLTALPAFRLGKLTAQSARLTYRDTIRQVLFGLAQAYYEVLKQARVLAVSRESLRLAQGQLDLAQTRADVGEVTRSDVLRASATVESNRRTVIEAENTLASRRNTLANILNLRGDTDFQVVDPASYRPTLPAFDTLLARALQQREDLQVRALAVEQDEQRRKGVIAEYAPKIVAQVNADANRYSGSSSSRTTSWDASLSVQMPFFTGGQREIDLAQAGYRIRQTRLDYESFAKDVQQEVKDGWLQVRTLLGTIEATRAQVVSAEQAYQDIRSEYEAGTATSVDVLSALNDQSTARRDLTTQTYELQVALRNLEYVTGVFQDARVRQIQFK